MSNFSHLQSGGCGKVKEGNIVHIALSSWKKGGYKSNKQTIIEFPDQDFQSELF